MFFGSKFWLAKYWAADHFVAPVAPPPPCPRSAWGASWLKGGVDRWGGSWGVETLAPDAPTGLVAVAGNGQVSLGWDAVAGADTYSVYRGLVSGGEALLVSGLASPSYIDTGLTNGITYYYKVSATNCAGESGLSEEVFATPTGTFSRIVGLKWLGDKWPGGKKKKKPVPKLEPVYDYRKAEAIAVALMMLDD